MSTRAIIHIYDEIDGFNIYLHQDGQPEKIRPAIEKAKTFTFKLPRFEAGDFATALIKVLKVRAWGVYLITSTEKISDVDYFYQIYEEDWYVKIKRTDRNLS